MKNIILRGPLLSKSGYGTHSRQVFEWLSETENSIRCEVTPWGITSWHVNPAGLNGLVEKIMNATGKEMKNPDISFQIQLPHEWDTKLAPINVGITAGVETDRVSKEWVEAVEKMNLVIVPSEFSKKAFLNSGVSEGKIIVIPESYSPYLENEYKIPDLSQIETDFNFLLFGQITSKSAEAVRKNLFYSVKWFCEEFKDNPDVGLVIKSNLGTNCVFHKNHLKDLFSKLVNEVRKGENPKIYLLNGDMSEEEVAGLLKNEKIKAMISFTRGEGYGLPLIDAAASGLPIIATNWSGHLDFLNRGHFNKVSYDLIEVPSSIQDGKIFVKNARWANPHEIDAKKRMRRFFESHARPKEWAIDLKEKVVKDFSLKAIFKKYDLALKELI